MKFLILLLKCCLATIIFDLLLLIICLALGSYFNILHSFSWFGFKVIVLPFSALAMLISIIYFSKKDQPTIETNTDQSHSEHSSRMEKYHDLENN